MKKLCHISQLKYLFRLEENVSRAVGQNSLILQGKQISPTPEGNNNMNFGLDQVVLLETAANL